MRADKVGSVVCRETICVVPRVNLWPQVVAWTSFVVVFEYVAFGRSGYCPSRP